MRRLFFLIPIIVFISIHTAPAIKAQSTAPASCYVISLGELNTGSAQRSPLPDLAAFTHYPENLPQLASELIGYASRQLLPSLDLGTGLLMSEGGAPEIRNSAVALLLWGALGEAEWLNRGVESILAEQILDPLSTEYGLFPNRVGEAAGRSDSAMFVGTSLMLVHDRYGHMLTDSVRERLLTAIHAAAVHTSCQNFFFRHTNYLLLRTYQLLRTGEMLDDPQLLAAGRALWDFTVHFTLSNGISEFNSTNYMRWNIYALSFIADDIEDEAVAEQAKQLQLLCWWSIVNHYLPAADQIAGPFSRTFTDRMIYEPTHVQPLLHYQSGGLIPHSLQQPEDANPYDSVYVTLLQPSLPSEWLDFALSPANPARTYQERVAIWRRGFQQTATYLEEFFALGSVNSADLRLNTNAEARLLVAHQVVPESGDVGVFTFRSETPVSASLNIVQSGRSLLGAVWIGQYERQVVDGELLLRFDWAGTESHPPALSYGNPLSTAEWMNTRVLFTLAPYTTAEHIKVEAVSEPEQSTVGLVLRLSLPPEFYEPPEGEPALLTLFALHFSRTTDEAELAPIQVVDDRQAQIFEVSWRSPEGDLLGLTLPRLPLQTMTFWEVGRAFINQNLLEEFPLGAGIFSDEDRNP